MPGPEGVDVGIFRVVPSWGPSARDVDDAVLLHQIIDVPAAARRDPADRRVPGLLQPDRAPWAHLSDRESSRRDRGRRIRLSTKGGIHLMAPDVWSLGANIGGALSGHARGDAGVVP